jgi:hypothetical protein
MSANVLKLKAEAIEKMTNLGLITTEEARAILDLSI